MPWAAKKASAPRVPSRSPEAELPLGSASSMPSGTRQQRQGCSSQTPRPRLLDSRQKCQQAALSHLQTKPVRRELCAGTTSLLLLPLPHAACAAAFLLGPSPVIAIELSDCAFAIPADRGVVLHRTLHSDFLGENGGQRSLLWAGCGVSPCICKAIDECDALCRPEPCRAGAGRRLGKLLELASLALQHPDLAISRSMTAGNQEARAGSRRRLRRHCCRRL